MGIPWDLDPKTAFYDWLYLHALNQNEELALHLLSFAGFTDIAFNPKRSINCQARSAALYVSLHKCGLLTEALSGRQAYLNILNVGNEITLQPEITLPVRSNGQYDLFDAI